MKPANSIFANVGTSIFEVMSRLAIEHKAFPTAMGPTMCVLPRTPRWTTGPTSIRR